MLVCENAMEEVEVDRSFGGDELDKESLWGEGAKMNEPKQAGLEKAPIGPPLIGGDDFPPLGSSTIADDELSIPNACELFFHADNIDDLEILAGDGLSIGEDWEIVSKDASVISMDSKPSLSFRDALSYSSNPRGNIVVPHAKWIARQAPLFAAVSRPACLAKKEEDGQDSMFDAYAMRIGAKNSRGGRQKYRHKKEPYKQQR